MVPIMLDAVLLARQLVKGYPRHVVLGRNRITKSSRVRYARRGTNFNGRLRYVTRSTSMPKIWTVISKLHAALMKGTHLAMLVGKLALPKACRMQHINEPQGLVPLCWNSEGLGVDVRSLQGRAFTEQITSEIPEPLSKPTQTDTMGALDMTKRG